MIELLELDRKDLEPEHAIGRAAALENGLPELSLHIGRFRGEPVWARGLEIQIFERRSEAARPPQHMAEMGAPRARHRSEQIGALRPCQALREVELAFVAGVHADGIGGLAARVKTKAPELLPAPSFSFLPIVRWGGGPPKVVEG